MSFKKQLTTLKENWLLIGLVLLLLAAMNFGSIGSRAFTSLSSFQDSASGGAYPMGAPAPDMAVSARYYGTDNFAPDAVKRVVTKSASLSTEVPRGEFTQAEQQLKSILGQYTTIIVSENVQKQDSERRQYSQGWYQIKVDTKQYAAAVSALKTIGEIQSFSESGEDITGQYTDTADQIATERARLARYQQMYSEASRIEDKININDRIFNQEMQIKYLEDSLENLDQRIEYSTISLTVTEKRSEYADIAFATLSGLIQDFVRSVNNILSLAFTLAPWAVLAAIGWLIWKKTHQ